MRRFAWGGSAIVFSLCCAGAPVPTEAAQRRPLRGSQEADFLFGPPRGFVGIRGGWQLARAESDIYEFFNEILTVEDGDFDSFVFGFDVGVSLHERIDLLVGVEVTRPSVDSEYRDFVEDNGLPITQVTRLTTVPLTGSVKLYLSPRGRSVSRFAFVPAKLSVYAGAGGGTIWYKLEQSGDFVDFTDLSIFTAGLRSDGWGLAAQVFGGVDVSLGKRWFLSGEGRYVWADASLGEDFVGFEPIDLSGLRITTGINVRF